MDAIRTVLTEKTADGGYITTIKIEGHDIFVYQPLDVMNGDIINYGYSAPLLMVAGNGAYGKDEAVRYADESGLSKIASENGGSVIFLNPLTNWDEEKEGLYEAVIAKTRIKQWGFSHGILYDDKVPRNPFEARAMEREGFDPVPEYYIFGSPVAAYIYTKGKGADYFARNYLREISGKSSMGDLGMADITMTAITLEGLSIVPEVSCEDVSIVSVGNSEEVNKALRSGRNRVAVCEKLDVIDQYDRYIGDYKRWAGKIRRSVNFRKEGIVMKPERMTVRTSQDNVVIKEKTHEVGYVLFYDEKLDLNDREHPFPLLLCFHGGGDTAVATAVIGEWPQIAKENGFMLCAVEMHLNVTASETMQIVNDLEKRYAIDAGRLYATGFSMGGIRSWDMYQEYPEYFAALAPMCATVDVGENAQFAKAPRVNQDVMVPVFYVGGEESPLAELPFQEGKCYERVKHTFKVNGVARSYDADKENKNSWEDPVYGVKGDEEELLHDPDFEGSVTHVRSFRSKDGNIYTKFVSVSKQKHEIRPYTCRLAYDFLKHFSRRNGKIEIG
ncbi:MAG: hypothetical protein IIZ28_04080 [Erysipelotrichaceae bacterium]|nr:hypothetical protein [Erysipelotrichaceae bacterium]